jgi:lysophospholipase L1-like esterase
MTISVGKRMKGVRMKRTLRISATLIASAFCAWNGAAQSQTSAVTTQVSASTSSSAPLAPVAWHDPSAKMKLILVGDSTVQGGSGWGPGFELKLKPGIECLNLAKGGRSSKSYRDEGRWAQALALKPTYIILGFSHNDILKGKPERYTTLEEFRANIKRYVDEAKAAGIKIVLMTSLADRKWAADGTFEDSPTLLSYEEATRSVAKEEDVPLIDITKLSTLFYKQKGQKDIDADSAIMKDGKIDFTHLNRQGGLEFGQYVANLTKTTVPDLAPYIE